MTTPPPSRDPDDRGAGTRESTVPAWAVLRDDILTHTRPDDPLTFTSDVIVGLLTEIIDLHARLDALPDDPWRR